MTATRTVPAPPPMPLGRRLHSAGAAALRPGSDGVWRGLQRQESRRTARHARGRRVSCVADLRSDAVGDCALLLDQMLGTLTSARSAVFQDTWHRLCTRPRTPAAARALHSLAHQHPATTRLAAAVATALAAEEAGDWAGAQRTARSAWTTGRRELPAMTRDAAVRRLGMLLGTVCDAHEPRVGLREAWQEIPIPDAYNATLATLAAHLPMTRPTSRSSADASSGVDCTSTVLGALDHIAGALQPSPDGLPESSAQQLERARVDALQRVTDRLRPTLRALADRTASVDSGTSPGSSAPAAAYHAIRATGVLIGSTIDRLTSDTLSPDVLTWGIPGHDAPGPAEALWHNHDSLHTAWQMMTAPSARDGVPSAAAHVHGATRFVLRHALTALEKAVDCYGHRDWAAARSHAVTASELMRGNRTPDAAIYTLRPRTPVAPPDPSPPPPPEIGDGDAENPQPPVQRPDGVDL